MSPEDVDVCATWVADGLVYNYYQPDQKARYCKTREKHKIRNVSEGSNSGCRQRSKTKVWAELVCSHSVRQSHERKDRRQIVRRPSADGQKTAVSRH